MNPRVRYGLVLLVATSSLAAAPLRCLFDGAHGSRFGNADWTIDGGYSDFAAALREQGLVVDEHRQGPLDDRTLAGVTVLILPEPNLPYGSDEAAAIRDFVRSGGGVLLIADHAGSDRNMDGWDSVDILNRLGAPMGVWFHHRWFTEVPLRGSVDVGPLTRWIRKMGIWSGTTVGWTTTRRAGGALYTDPAGDGRGRPVLVGCPYGAGRVVALGDSSPFDDGTGDPTKKLHDSFNSFLFDTRQLAVNCVRWLARSEPNRLPPPAGIRFVSREDVGAAAAAGPLVLVDAGHVNEAADKLDRFAERASASGRPTLFADVPLDPAVLNEAALVVIDNPAEPYRPAEIGALADFVRAGGSLLVTCRGGGARGGGRHSILNPLVQGLGSRLRFAPLQVFDETENYGRPWSLVLSRFGGHPVTKGVERLLFWNPCPIVPAEPPAWPADATVIATAGPKGHVECPPDVVPAKTGYAGPPIVLVAEERLGRGRLLLAGTCTLTNFQYTDERRAEGIRDAVGVGEHQTPVFNQNLVDRLAVRRTGAERR